MNTPMVLSLFPGADLLGRAFEAAGCCVVRGPEILLGQDIRDWPWPPPGRLDGIIGGPPCQPFSQARNIGGQSSRHQDMIPLFWQIVRQAKPKWAVMENVPSVATHPAMPEDATPIVISDFDCGGQTQRRRVFVFWPAMLVLAPRVQYGRGELSVIASSWKTGGLRRKTSLRAGTTAREAGAAQGWPEVAEAMLAEAAQDRLYPQRFIVRVLGNGVPRAMGEYVARVIMDQYHSEAYRGEESKVSA